MGQNDHPSPLSSPPESTLPWNPTSWRIIPYRLFPRSLSTSPWQGWKNDYLHGPQKHGNREVPINTGEVATKHVGFGCPWHVYLRTSISHLRSVGGSSELSLDRSRSNRPHQSTPGLLKGARKHWIAFFIFFHHLSMDPSDNSSRCFWKQTKPNQPLNKQTAFFP